MQQFCEENIYAFLQVKKVWLETTQMSHNNSTKNKCDIFLKMEYYIAVKNEEIQLSAATWILINT